MSIPSFLLVEVRLAFRTCLYRHSSNAVQRFSSVSSALRRQDVPRSRPPKPSNQPSQFDKERSKSGTTGVLDEAESTPEGTSSRELVPQEQERRSVGTSRKIPVPMKILPKADITPNLRLSPKERLHLEVLTRRAPPLPEKKVYRERLLIYHWGFGRENALAILKMSCIVGACAVTFIIAPAHMAAGTPFWTTSLIFLAGFIPAIAVNYMTKPMISRVFLRLPPPARENPKVAMEYAQNLPKNAELDIRFLRPWALEGSISARMSELEPAPNNWLRPLTFQWVGPNVNKGSMFLPNPTKFFVAPKSATGKAARDTIPGLWESVYQKLAGVESDAVSRWRR